MTTPADHLRAGYATAETQMARRRREVLAAQYRPDDHMERIGALPAPARETLFAASPTVRISHGIYTAQRDAFEAEQAAHAAENGDTE